MTLRVKFENVSKQYRLGLTRSSLPSILAHGAQRLLRRGGPENVSQRDFWALKEINFDLHPGESLALIGRNGAGKTTILKLLANITKPTNGKIESHGQLSALIELGAGFHPDLTGRENIYLNGAILGLSRRQISQRFDEIVDFSELAQFIDTPVKRYSSGMTVRLGFAVASCIEPEILLVDEVLAVGDAPFQQKCMRRIRGLIEQGTSIIFVSHNFYLVQAVCEKALYLKHGQIFHRGSAQEVIRVYEQDLHEERARKFAATEEHLAFDDDSQIEITYVEVCGSNGEQRSEHFSSREAISIRIHYNAYRALGKIHASVFITRADGLTCCMMRTMLDRVELFVDRGCGIVTVTLEPLQLISGSYFAEAWFLNETDSMGITSRPGRSDWFTVKGVGLSYTDTSGVFEPHTRWEHSHNQQGRFSSTNDMILESSVRAVVENSPSC
ncbi:MAG: ABC transporter ATP-binding protein [Caldilinea sp.]|jgi:lipopolysaccharide transport system ATP-binding protein|nr:ABC transporter ATP-binding protein [Caldilinea sp.]